MANHKDDGELSLRARRALKQAHSMSLAAVVLGVASVGLVAFAAVQSRSGGAVDQAAATSAIGLSAEAARDAGPAHGWYRTRLRSMVRQTAEMDSAAVSILPAGTFVWVEEEHGRRVRVAHPVDGWCSLRTADGLEILHRDRSKDDMGEVDKLLAKDKKFLQAQERLKDVQKKLSDAKDRLQSSIAGLEKQKAVKTAVADAKHVWAEAPRLEHKAIDGASKLVDRAVKPKEAKDFLDGLGGQPKLDSFVHDAEAEAASATRGVAGQVAHTSIGAELEQKVGAGAREQGEELVHAAGEVLH